MCHSGIDDFPRRRPHAARRHAPRGGARPAGGRSRRAESVRPARAGAAAGRTACATISPRGRSSPSARRSRARSISRRRAGCALHVVHVSSSRGMALIAEARARGVDVTRETCPHYLLLTDEDMERLGAVAKCAPPLRPAAEREALWGALADGGCRWSPPTTRRRRRRSRRATCFTRGAVSPARRPRCRSCSARAGFRASASRGAGRLTGPAAAAGAQGTDRAGRRRRPRARRPGRARRAACRGPAAAPPRLAVRRPHAARAGGAHDPARAHGVRRRAPRGRALRPAGDAGMSGDLHSAIDRLAEFNDDPAAGGITREVYTPIYAAALEWVAEQMRAAGLQTRVDAFGNLWGRWEGAEPGLRASSPARTSTRRSTPAATTAWSACWARSRPCTRCATRVSSRAAASRWLPSPGRSRASGRAASAAARSSARSVRTTSTRCATATASRWRRPCAGPASTRRGSPTRAWIPRRCTRSSSCTSSRGSCSRRTGRRSAS